MAINLEKNAQINLSKTFATLTRIRFDAGWEPNPLGKGDDFDVDASVFVLRDLGKGPKLLSEDYLIFYGNEADPELAVIHSGDNLDGSGDDRVKESITIDLSKLTARAAELSFIVTIHKAVERKQNFGMVNNSFVELVNDETNEILCKYSLEDDFSRETAVQFGSLYKQNNEWLFKAVGAGYERSLGDFVEHYGQSVKK